MPLPQKYNIYHEYKYSGINWLGAIPKRWSLKPIKYATYINPKVLSEKTNADQEINYIDISSVNCNGIINNVQKLKFSDAPSRARRIVDSGDTIVSTVRTYLRAIAFIDKRKDGFICSTGFAVLKPRKFLHAKYLAYYVMSTQFVDNIVANSVGVSYPAINSSDVGSMPIILPSFKEQQKISAFLDRETSKLDRLIEKKERLIELLKEKRQAIINQAITKGLDPNVSMKGSGIEWLGKIPEHWEVIKLKYLIHRIQTGSTPSTNNREFFDGNIDWFTPGDFKEGINLYNSERKLTEMAIAKREAYLLPTKTVLLVGIGATLGKVAITKKACAFNQQITGIITNINLILPEYLTYWLYLIKSYIQSEANFTTLPIINNNGVKNLFCLVPPVLEQVKIITFIEMKNKQINTLVKSLENQIAKIKEYRQALISAAVTGKIDVRDEV